MSRTSNELELIARVADGLPCGVWVACVPSGELAYANRRFTEIIGMTARADVAVGEYAQPYGIHTRTGELYPEKRMPFVRAIEAKARVVNDDIAIHRHDGTKVYVRAEATPLFDGEGAMTHVVIAFIDITPEVVAQGAQAESEARLVRAQRMEGIGQLAGGIAHDFNNLLGTVTTLVSTLRLHERDEGRIEALTLIEQVASTGAQLTRSLLGFARRGKNLSARLSLRDAVKSNAPLFTRTVGRGIEVRFDLGDGPADVIGDVSQIEQVLFNLVLNARDATPDGGCIQVRVRTKELSDGEAKRLGAPRPGTHVVLEVEDNGTGIDPAIRARIFEPYFTTKTKGPHLGTGLGLATVEGIVSAHLGAIEVLDASPRGTVMRVFLPAAAVQGTTAEAPRREVRSSERPLLKRGSGEILVGDDDALLRGALDNTLRAIGYRPVLVANGAEVVERYRESPDRFPVVLLDLLMPGQSARETFEQLRAIRPNVRVLLMTGFARNEQVQSLLDAGVRGFIAKPFSAESLSDAIERLRQG